MLVNTADRFLYELNPGERVIWSGQPRQGLVLRVADALMIPFSLMWGGFVFFWEFEVVTGGAPFFFMLWGIPFMLMGLYITVGRFFVDMAQRSKTYYAITNERVLILSGLFHQNMKALKPQRIAEINVSTGWNDSGTITFGASHPMSWFLGGSGFPNMGRYHIAPSFEMIDDVRTVYEKIKKLQREDRQ